MLMNLLAALGLVWIIKDSYILKIPREYLKSKSKHLQEFLSCSLCLGFWAGVLLSFFDYFLLKKYCLSIILYPLSTAAFCWFFDSTLDMIQEIWVSFKKQRENS